MVCSIPTLFLWGSCPEGHSTNTAAKLGFCTLRAELSHKHFPTLSRLKLRLLSSTQTMQVSVCLYSTFASSNHACTCAQGSMNARSSFQDTCMNACNLQHCLTWWVISWSAFWPDQKQPKKEYIYPSPSLPTSPMMCLRIQCQKTG